MPVAAVFLNDATVMFWLIVTVNVFEYTSSLAPGNTVDAKKTPVELSCHVANADQLPLATAL
jgi:hypothetical protein